MELHGQVKVWRILTHTKKTNNFRLRFGSGSTSFLITYLILHIFMMMKR
jgi:hypothetical protein